MLAAFVAHENLRILKAVKKCENRLNYLQKRGH